MSQEVIEVLNWFADKLGISVDWTQENIMPMISELCQKYARYEITTSIAWIVFVVILISAGIISFKSINKFCDYILEEFWLLILFAIIIVSVSIIMYQIYDIAKCINFPELAFAEYLKTLIGTNS